MGIVSHEDRAPVTGSGDPTSVYRYYDEQGILLYVGITRQGMSRNAQHNGRAEWWPYVVRQEVEHYATRTLAAAREKELIWSFRPPFNRQHNADSEVLRAAYLAVAVGNADGRSAVEIFSAYGRAIPVVAMAPMSHSRIAFRTEPVDARLSSAVAIAPPVPVLSAGSRVGWITGNRRQGSLLILRCELKRGATHVERALLRMKHDSKGKCFTPTFLDLGPTVVRAIRGAAA